MVRITVPPINTRLREILEQPKKTGELNDDVTWKSTLLPLLLERLKTVKEAVHQAQTTNANGPTGKEVDKIYSSCDKIKEYLGKNFADAAPFTIYRIAELVLEPEKSGYLLSTMQLVERYLAAFARTVMVVSKETEFFGDVDKDESTESNGSNGVRKESDTELNKATPADYEKYDLPRDVKFISLPWAQPKKASIDESSIAEDTNSPPAKKAKCEEPTQEKTGEEHLEYEPSATPSNGLQEKPESLQQTN